MDARSRRAQREVNAVPVQRTTYGYDAANRLTQVDSTLVGVGTFARSMTHDALGNRLTTTEQLGAVPYSSATYTYDALAQLASSTVSGLMSTVYHYDAVGNRTQVTAGATPIPFSVNALNQYTSVAGFALQYDANGNVTSEGLHTFAYEAENRLTTATGPGLAASYTYDAFGRRLAKTVNGATTRLLYDGDQLLEDRSPTGALQALYVYGPGIDEVLLRLDATTGALQVSHQDALGSTQFLLGFDGAPLELYTYDAYGQPAAPSALGYRFLFTGREYDQETGLVFLRGRYYSPILGRFLSREPVWEDVNPYRYVLNSPTNWVDPDGLNYISPTPPPINWHPPMGLPGTGIPIDVPVSGPQGLSDWTPPWQKPHTGPDLIPEPTPGTSAGQRQGSKWGGVQKGVLVASGNKKGDEQRNKKPPQSRRGDFRWDEKRQRWVDDEGVYTKHDRGPETPHWDFGSYDGRTQAKSYDGVNWIPK